MSVENPYEELGLTEDASFDEIQAARNRLIQEYSSDPKRVEMLEAAYDAILMERLRMRQEGKIKVPERIRFAERLTQAPPSSPPAPAKQSPAWLQRLIDTPNRADILWPGGIFLGLGLLSFFAAPTNPAILQLTFALGMAITLFFLHRKEKLFGRAVLLTLVGLLAGLTLGGLFYGLVVAQFGPIGLTDGQFITCIAFVVLWLVTSFLR